jgi:cyclophilin family peptidyl-prolyl cis-trans isomerase
MKSASPFAALVTLFAIAGCNRACNRPGSPAPAADAGARLSTAAADPKRIERATDVRKGSELVDLLGDSADVLVRRRVARGLARVADEASSVTLRRLLSDEDDDVVAWSAYGLGFGCKLHPDAHVAALAARATTWSAARASVDAGSPSVGLDAGYALARALGHCATPLAERTLADWVKSRALLAEPATYALGDVIGRGGKLSDESITALLDAAPPAHGQRAFPSALFPFSRMTPIPDAFRTRVVEAARAGLAEPGDSRIFAVRALGRAGAADAGLFGIVVDRAFSVAERVEAARGLGQSGLKGRRAAHDALLRLAPGVISAPPSLASAEYHVLVTLLETERQPPGPGGGDAGADKTLYALASLAVQADRTSPLGRRVDEVRCRAAGVLARAEFDAEILQACAPEGSEARERATLASVLGGSIAGKRRAQYVKLARSANIRTREAALEGAAAHPEIGEALWPLVADALASKKPGLVATTAELILAHPMRFFEEEGRGRMAPIIDKPFTAVLEEPWAEDLVETKAALLDAAVAVGHPKAKAITITTCSDANVTLRQRGLKWIGQSSPEKCEPRPIQPAKELDALLERPTRLVFDISGVPLTIQLDPALTPVTSTRLVALARAGFFRGIVVHRVVPGFVVQLGDPGGDGYGGAGTSLRCETSPVPFAPLDVGMALAGRDTGSSQFFVTLSRTPHLDGEYARIGRAEGDWASVIEGDSVTDVRVAE